MWLTGALLLSCFYGWSREKMKEVLTNMKTNLFLELPPETPDKLSDLLKCMLHPNPEKRLSVEGFLAHSFPNSTNFL